MSEKTTLFIYGADWKPIEDEYKENLKSCLETVLEKEKNTVSSVTTSQNSSGDQETEQDKTPGEEELFAKFFQSSSLNSTNKPFNLGVYMDKDTGKKLKLKCSTFIGAVPLIDKYDKNVRNDIILMVSSRFALSPIEMINTVLDSEEYWENPDLFQYKNYSGDEWKDGLNINNNSKEKILFGQIDGLPLIDLKGGGEEESNRFVNLADTVGLFETIDFIKKAKDICKKSIMKKTQVVEENLVCKVKGRIVLNKQIKFNLSKGMNHKSYCSYNKMVDNNKENQILKYALYLCLKSENIPEVLKEDINTCMTVLSGVSLRKCTISDFVGLKNNSAYRQYKDALETAKKIISRFSLNYKKDGEPETFTDNYKVKPFFIDMNVLVELYCRAVIKDVISKNPDFKNELRLVSFGKSKKYMMFDKVEEENEKSLEKDNDRLLCKVFMNTYIPDIIIEKVKPGKSKQRKQEYEPFIVLDAKNSDLENQSSESRRSRTHQVNFYMNVMNVKIGGLVCPSDSQKEYLATSIRDLDEKNEKKLVFVPLKTSLKDIGKKSITIPDYLDGNNGELDIKTLHRITVNNLLIEMMENTNNKKGKGDKQCQK